MSAYRDLDAPAESAEPMSCGPGCFRKFLRNNRVMVYTAVGVVLGFIIGAIVGQMNPSKAVIQLIKVPGTIFLRVLKMLVLPLIVTSVIVGVIEMRRAGGGTKKGLRTLGYYALTSFLAVILGLVLVTTIQPGVIAQDRSLTPPKATSDALTVSLDVLYFMFPDNIVAAAANLNALGLIVWSIIFALVATSVPQGRVVLELVESINAIVMVIIRHAMHFTPLGVASLLIGRLAEAGDQFWAIVESLGLYMLTVIVGLVIHGGIVLPLMYYVMLHKKPYSFAFQLSQPLLTAFGTASSSATLPISLRECVESAGVSEATARFVLPLGATVNMDGTALYEAVAAIFIAQSFGVSLSVGGAITIALTAVLASVGAAGIPEAGLVTMVLVLKAADLPVEGIALLLPVDWLLDRCRTTVNVWGDLVGAAIIDKYTEDAALPSDSSATAPASVPPPTPTVEESV